MCTDCSYDVAEILRSSFRRNLRSATLAYGSFGCHASKTAEEKLLNITLPDEDRRKPEVKASHQKPVREAMMGPGCHSTACVYHAQLLRLDNKVVAVAAVRYLAGSKPSQQSRHQYRDEHK